MLSSLSIHNKKVTNTIIAVLLSAIALFVYAQDIRWLALPFVALYVMLLFFNWKIAYWILLGCIPFSIHIFLAGKSLSTSLPDEPLMWMFLLFFAIVWASKPKIFPDWFWKNPLTTILLLQFVWLVVAVIYSQEKFISIKFLLAKCWFLTSYLLIPIFVFREKKDFKKGFFIFFIPLLITMLIIFVRHGVLYQFQYNPGIEKAISILYYNHVDYSTVISMFFPAVCIAYTLIDKQKKLLRRFWMGIILFFIAAIFLAYARAAMLAVIFCAIIAWAIKKKLVNWLMAAFFTVLIGLTSLLIYKNNYIALRPDFEQTYTHRSFQSHIIATFRGQDMSSMERLYRWIAAVRMSTEHPMVGFGPNSFYFYYKPYAVTMFRTYVSRNPERSTTHNYFLFMLVEQGWPAMLLYGVLVVTFFAQAQRTYHKFKDRFYKQVTLGVAMMFAASFVNNFFSELIETHKVGALFYMSISLLIILIHKSKKEQEQTSHPLP